MITAIEIENIKGIKHKRLELNIIPNRPSILVAPNGFGKSSLATAFTSMNNRRIKLDDENCYEENTNNLPRIAIELRRQDSTIVHLEATNSTNTISNEISFFVITNRTYARGKGSQYGRATGSMEIESIILIDRIPNNVSFNYSFQRLKTKFGNNAKVLPNLDNVVFNNLKLIKNITNYYQDLQRANGQRIQSSIINIINQINAQQGTEQQILDNIRNNHLQRLQAINHLNSIANCINHFINDEVKSYLAAIQLIWLSNVNINNFKNACEYNNYKLNKQRFEELFSNFTRSIWKDIKAKETHGQLIVNFPKATEISNGQGDILTLVAMIFRAERKLDNTENILIIDEVFDYLDDANLIAAQYYITKFIDYSKSKNKNIYPLILTHLNPFYFKNFAFNTQKVYYLDKAIGVNVNDNLKKLLRYRNDVNKDETIDNNISLYLLHYHNAPNNNIIQEIFTRLRIPTNWNFSRYLNEQKENYLHDQPYDPLAVCGALRIKIEEIAYNQLQNDVDKQDFISTHKTREKLEFAETKNVNSSETHYLLGIIYNEAMHWKDDNNFDNITPIISKLKNLVIRNMIKNVFDMP